MKFLTNWFAVPLAVILMANVAAAGDMVASGKVKSINADNKTFVLADSAEKENTFSFGDAIVINRDGKETNSGLKPGDAINVCYEKGMVTWTAHYILVQEGASKHSELIRGNVKGYDTEKKELTVTTEAKKDVAYSVTKAEVRVNMKDAKIEEVKIGDHALLIVSTVDGKTTLHRLMIDRKK